MVDNQSINSYNNRKGRMVIYMSSTSLNGVYSDGIVLQRNKDIIITGREAKLTGVKVTLAGITKEVPVSEGIFKAVFPPMAAAEGLTLKAEGTDVIEVNDVCIGDVFMLSGQSNMELPVSRTYDLNKEEVDSKDYGFIRQFTVDPDYELPQKGEESVCKFPGGSWFKAEGEAKMNFSAVGFYAARRIYEKTGVPVGLILNAKGGASIESFMCEEDLVKAGIREDEIAPFRGKGAIKEYVASSERYTASWRSGTVDGAFELNKALESASGVELPGIVVKDFAGSMWFVRELELGYQPEGDCFLRLGDLIDADVTYVNGVEVGRTEYQYPPRKYHLDGSILKPGKNVIATRLIIELGKGGFVPGHPYYLRTDKETIDLTGTWKMVPEKKVDEFIPPKMPVMIPMSIYYSSLVPFEGYGIAGIWWYQGESNSDDPRGYDQKMALLFARMRKMFGNVPVVLIKIADYINPLTFAAEVPEGWRKIQELQEEAQDLIRDLKVVEAPVPDPVYELHPQDKSGIGADVAKAVLESFL